MKAIKEYLDLRHAKKIKREFDKLLPPGVACTLTCDVDSYQPWQLKIQNKYGGVRELSEKENDIEEIISILMKACKQYHMSFTFSKHGLEYVYISIEVKE